MCGIVAYLGKKAAQRSWLKVHGLSTGVLAGAAAGMAAYVKK
jgi:hypothetical protein